MADISDIPNPWIPQSEADNSHVPDTAAALADLGRSAAAVLIEPDATDYIGDLLRCAMMPADPAPSNGFPDGFDPHVFMDTLEAIVEAIDPLPLFLRRTG